MNAYDRLTQVLQRLVDALDAAPGIIPDDTVRNGYLHTAWRVDLSGEARRRTGYKAACDLRAAIREAKDVISQMERGA